MFHLIPPRLRLRFFLFFFLPFLCQPLMYRSPRVIFSSQCTNLKCLALGKSKWPLKTRMYLAPSTVDFIPHTSSSACRSACRQLAAVTAALHGDGGDACLVQECGIMTDNNPFSQCKTVSLSSATSWFPFFKHNILQLSACVFCARVPTVAIAPSGKTSPLKTFHISEVLMFTITSSQRLSRFGGHNV